MLARPARQKVPGRSPDRPQVQRPVVAMVVVVVVVAVAGDWTQWRQGSRLRAGRRRYVATRAPWRSRRRCTPHEGEPILNFVSRHARGVMRRWTIHARVQTRSMIVAMPMPPPMQSVMSAVASPRRSSSSSAVPRRAAPVAPSGCP